ncbi:hypothetical protein GGE07_001440 [Sinorhizobium terangae]|nr:hypothetical protein [Sinorhizobium terangae]
MIETHPDLPETARSLSFGLLQHIESLTDKINAVSKTCEPERDRTRLPRA